MAHEIFISYSSNDKTTADAVCHTLEENGIRCWIAPRDVRPGFSYGAEITGSIRDCRILLLIFSENSSRSDHVKNEIERAFGNEKIIIPYRIDETPMDDEMQYFLSRKHWIDAFPDNADRFQTLLAAVKSVLGMPITQTNAASAAATSPQAPRMPEADLARHGFEAAAHQKGPAESEPPVSSPAPVQVVAPAATADAGTTSVPAFVPVGCAHITLQDGQKFEVPGNALLFRDVGGIKTCLNTSTAGVNQGTLDFSRIKEIRQDSATQFDCLFRVATVDGQVFDAKCYENNRFVFPRNHTCYEAPVLAVKSIEFDHEGSCPGEIDMMAVHLRGGDTLFMPRHLFFVAYKDAPPPEEPGITRTGWSSPMQWTNSIETGRGQALALDKLKEMRFLELTLASDRWSDRWIGTSKVEFVLLDGRSLTTSLGKDSYYFHGVDDFGPMEVKIEDIERLEFVP